MKFLLKVIGVVASIGAAVLLLMLLINDTFIKSKFSTSLMDGDGIPIQMFMYRKDSVDESGNFITLSLTGSLNKTKEKYLKKLNNCYGIFYYDEDNDITIVDYDIKSKGLYREVTIKYDDNNYCGDRYILDDTWVFDIPFMSKADDLSISLNKLYNLLDVIQSATRNLEPIVNPDYKSTSSITYSYSKVDGRYYVEIKDFSPTEIVIVITKNENSEFAVYQVEDAPALMKRIIEN